MENSDDARATRQQNTLQPQQGAYAAIQKAAAAYSEETTGSRTGTRACFIVLLDSFMTHTGLFRYFIVLCSALCCTLVCFTEAEAQNKVSFSLQNRQTAAGIYYVDLWATISTGATWQPGNCTIAIEFNHSALSLTDFSNASLLNPDSALNSGNYFPMYQSSYDSALSVTILNFSSNFADKSGSFRIGTLRWRIVNGFLLDSLRFLTSGPVESVISNGWEFMSYNCGDSTCYAAVNPTPAQTGNPPVVSQQPESAVLCPGGTTTLSVQATGATLSYQWQQKVNATWASITGATSASLLVSATTGTVEYRVVVSGNAPPVATSQVVQVTTTYVPSVQQHPAPVSICAGADATFTAVFESVWPQPSITWETQSAGSSTWTTVPGALSTTLTISAADAVLNGTLYRAKATMLCGTATTDSALLTVNSSPNITTQATVVTAVAGSTASFGITATGIGNSYRWQKNNTDIAEASTATLSLAGVQISDIGLYRAIVSNTCGSDTSEQILLYVQAVDTTKTPVTVKALMQGYWDGANHVRTPVSVELRSGSVLASSTIASIQAGILQSNGTITLEFNDIQSGNYWIVVRHGGYLPVASAAPISVTRGTATSYDFSNAASKAFANGTLAVTIGGQTVYVLKGGDLNGNRAVNPQDLPLFLMGYPKTNTGVPGL